MDQAGIRRNAETGKPNWVQDFKNFDTGIINSARPEELRTSEISFETERSLFELDKVRRESNELGKAFLKNHRVRTLLPATERAYYLDRIALLENQLAKANKEKEESKHFLANLSHEVRNSVNTIVGMTSLLHDDDSVSNQKKHLGHLKEASDLLLALVTNVLDLSKMDQGQLKPRKKSMALEPLLNSLAKTTEFRLWDKALHFKYYLSPALPKRVISDQVMLYQILLNLLGNAIKFTERGGISFSIQPFSFDNNICWVEFLVSDTGIGFSEQKKARIFNRFEQDGSQKFKEQGAGLGLAISKNLISLLGGSITAESQVGKGSAFCVRLPFEIEQQDTQAEVAPVVPSKPSFFHSSIQNILVVEDNPLNQVYLQSLLDRWGYKVTLAENGEEALELLEEKTFDLAFVDLRIPIINGFETCIRLRNMLNNANRNIPVIATSGCIEEENRLKALSVGMNAYLCKPFAPQEVFNTLQQYQQQEKVVDPFKTFEFSTDFDQLGLQQLYMDNYDQVKLMFEIFLKNTPGNMAKIEETWHREDWTAFNDLVHKIKPTFSMVGLNDISVLAKKLEEDSGKQKPKNFIKETFSKFWEAATKSIKMVALEKEKLESFQIINP